MPSELSSRLDERVAIATGGVPGLERFRERFGVSSRAAGFGNPCVAGEGS